MVTSRRSESRIRNIAVFQFFYGRYLLIGKGILKKLLGIIDDVLKSILDAVGGPSPKSKPAVELRKLRRRAKLL